MCSGLHNKLHHFPKVKKVSVNVPNIDVSTINVIENMERLIKNGSVTISEFKMKLADTISFDFPTEELDTIQLTTSIEGLYLLASTLSYLPIPGDIFLIYIMKKFPNLIQLKLVNKESINNGALSAHSSFATSS